MTDKSIRVGLIQNKCGADISKNVEHVISKIEEAARNQANVICLQELFTTTYFCKEVKEVYYDYAESMPGSLSDRFSELAKKYNIVLILPYFERAAAGLYFNSAAVIDADGSYMGKYRKMHIPDDPGFYEKYYFTPGDTGFKVFNTQYGKIGVLICWDQWFPEAARITALKGADIIFYPTAIGTLPEEGKEEKRKFLNAWQTIQKSHAVANGCYVASVNRVGTEDTISFWGHSFVAGPFGETLAEAGEDEDILIAECDFSKIETQRRTWPFFRDRRIDSYEGIQRRYIENE
ncbi:MAG TPA: carbon-nitrogen hydrolase [Balneolales bacterium]|nr:carbon-nitrogen hydrolase [Balneolales bacterium]